MTSYTETRFKLTFYKFYIRPFLYLLINKIISIAEKNNIEESLIHLDNLISDLANPFIENKDAIDTFMDRYEGESELKDIIKESIDSVHLS